MQKRKYVTQYAERLARKEGIDWLRPPLPSERGEDRWNLVEERISLLELELTINSAFYAAEDDEITLVENWKSRANTYIAHIREVVPKQICRKHYGNA